MATKLERLKWELFKLKNQGLILSGFKKGLIRPYDDELIENLRHVYYGGIPASILLLLDNYCQGKCYDRALLITFGFGDDDFRLVDADIDSITLQPRYVDKYRNSSDIHYGNHCFAERTTKDGTTWVYDTTAGLVFEKDLYYKLQSPKVTTVIDKQQVINNIEYQEIKNANMEQNKHVLPLIMPHIEESVEKALPFYQAIVRDEIELFKKEINYDNIEKAIQDDMRESILLYYKMKKNKPKP
ncbi:MAG: hypothetical protein IJO43_02070 [Bacilli bacterium]|nr:hypothetical protein [Bacilli bacterium]